ncbi:secretion protein EspB [Mycobacterium sp. 1423905.2]|uniref:PPE domain-containing protein n=1 Tax=Mycobacterium sp. 1423905.2 TaxID=1856859 RepID=UPI0007FBD08B|nr:secretion protein EspB [Mycobacterium sp. 1423905.2]OBJ55118.1 secretion protein EspB [Mycobacterium sp. 1423905.2]
MTQPQTVKVDQQEILSRADEVEAPMAVPPTDVPQAPCGLNAARNAALQLEINADSMREFLTAGGKERQRLATSLRNAAKAYGDVDDDAASALNSDGEGHVEGETAGGAGGDSSAGLRDGQDVTAAGEPDFTDLKTAATKLEAGDQGRSLGNFADGWDTLNYALQRDVKRFRGFDNWEGDAAAACTQSLEDQRKWIIYMADMAAALSQQGRFLAQLQLWARRKHPTLADIEKLEEMAKDPKYKAQAIKLYSEYQATSEETLSEYSSKVSQIKRLDIAKPPQAVKIDPPAPPQPQGLIPSQVMQFAGATGGQSGTGMQPPMMPPTAGAGAGGGMPAGAAAELTSATRDAAASLPKDPGIKPMSLGGGGGAGGGAPSMPLAPATGGMAGDSVRPAGAGDLGGFGAGKAPAGSGMAGGGMGMPMGGHGQGQGGSKSKGAKQDDEALYTEDREWTEAVIGNRRRQDSKESK